jgi:hypothetical protein
VFGSEKNPNFAPPNLICGFMDWCFWFFGTYGTFGTSGTLVFWYFWYFVKLGFYFSGDPTTEKVR